MDFGSKKIPTYEITAEDALEEDVLPGVDLDHVPGGKGDVHKVADPVAHYHYYHYHCHLMDCKQMTTSA